MASYMSSIIDVLVTDVLEYLGGPASAPTESSPPSGDANTLSPVYIIPHLTDAPTKPKQKSVAPYSNLSGYAVISAVVALLLMLMLCRRCHRRKRARVAFAGVPSSGQNTGVASCRRIHVSSLMVQSKYRPVESVPIVIRQCKGDSDSCETQELQPRFMVPCPSDNVSNDSEANGTQPDIDSSRVKEGVKRKLEEGMGSATGTAKKNLQYSSQQPPKEPPKRQYQQHAYTYASPHRKEAEVVKSANTASYQSEDFKTRWKGSIPKCRLNKIRCRYAREALQSASKKNSAQTRDFHLRKQRNMNHGASTTLHASSNSSPFSKPVYPFLAQSPQQLSRNAHPKSSPGKRKLVKKSKTQAAAADNNISGVVNFKGSFQKGKENYRTNQDWTTLCKNKDMLGTRLTQKSPKKLKKSSVLLKGKKLSGQRKAKKARKKHKLKENMKSMRIAIEKVSFPDRRIPANYCHFPEAYRGVHVPAVVRQASTKGTRAESFTIKRTATPVLSSLLGQGAFRTCWPQSEHKSIVYTQEHDGNGNTGRHNTNFLGPKLPDCNNETSECTNYSRTKHIQFWNKCDFNPQGRGNTADMGTHTGFVFTGKANPQNNLFLHIPNLQTSSQHPLVTKECRNVFNVENNKVTSTVCLNSRLGEAKMSNGSKNSSSQRHEQLCASFHAEKPRQQTDCWNSSSKLKFTPESPTVDLHEEGGMHANVEAQLPKARIKGQGQNNKQSAWGNLPIQCPHMSSNRNPSGVIPELWTHGDKHVHISHQPKDTNIKMHPEDLRKRYPNHNTQCPQQCQCISFVTGYSDNRQVPTIADNTVCDKQHTADVKQCTHNKKQPDTKPGFHNTDTSHAAALPQCSDNANPLDLKEFRNLWETKITHEGNVFRLTRNHTLPSRLTHDDFQRLQESSNSGARCEVRQKNGDMWPDSEDKTLTLSHRHEGKKGHSTKAVALCKDVNHDCSKHLDNIHSQPRTGPLNKEMTTVSCVRRKDDHTRLEKHQTAIFGAGYTDKMVPRQLKTSKVQNVQSIPADSPTAKEWPDFGIRVYDRLNQSSSPTDDEASGVESESPSDQQHEVKGQSTQSKHVACTQCFQNEAETHMQEKSHRCGCRQHHLVKHKGRDENDAADHDNWHDVKYHKRKPTEKPTGKASVVHGHVVKRNKSLISVRNMLNELTSHLRANHENNYPAVQTHARKPRGKTLYYFKPTHLTPEDPQSRKEDDLNRTHKSMHSHAHKCSNATEGIADHHGKEKYVKCYRSRKFKVYRHEPYRKRVPTSSDSTVTPSSGYYWTRNKNNCSPSRKGRYVLGPLVDKHVFTEEQNNSEMGTAEGSGSNSVIEQQDNRITVGAEALQNTQRLGNMTLDNTDIKYEDTEHSDIEQETKERENMAFATPVFSKTRPVPVDNKDKEQVDMWNYDDADQSQTRHASARPAAATQPDDGDSKTDRAIREHTNAGHKIPAETRYQIIRQYCGMFPEASHTIKRHIPTGYATKGDTTARHTMKVCTAKRSVRKGNTCVENVDQENSHTYRIHERYKGSVHVVRHDNQTDHIAETNERVEDTNTEQRENEESTCRRRYTGQLVIRQNFLKQATANNYVKDTQQQSTTKKSTPAAGVSSKKVSDVNTEAGCSLDRPTAIKHTTKQTMGVEGDRKDHHSTSRDHDKKQGTIFCSENYSKSQGSLNTDKKHDQRDEGYHQCKQNTLGTPMFSHMKAGETGANESTMKGDDKLLCLRAAEASETKSKVTAPRAGCSRQQLNRFNIMKTQGCLARLKASRGPLSQRYPGPFERNKSVRAGRLLVNNNKIPTTQSHTTQTENCVNSAHVGVQTSPGLQAAERRTPRHSKMRRHLINPRLCRDKVVQKECLLSRHKVYRKHSANALNSLSTLASQPVQINNYEHSIIRNHESQNETVLESHAGASENPNRILEQTVKENDFEQLPAASEFTDFSNRRKYTSFEDHSRNDRASNSERLQDIHLRETMNTHDNYGTDNEFPERKETLQDGETGDDSQRRDDKQKDRTFILEFPNAQFSGTQNTGYHDAKSLPNVDSRENEKCSASKISRQTSKDMQTSEVSEEREFSTTAVTPRSNRIRALASSDSSALSSRLSELSKFCVIRPIWKNANIEEIDRRVRRALKLREELKQSGTSGSRARSLITSYFEASAAENAGKSSDGVTSGASSTFASDFDSTNRSTYPMSRDQHTSFQDTGSDDTLCQKGEHKPVTGGRSSSSEDNRTKQGDEVSGSAVIEASQPGSSLRWTHKQVGSAAAAEQKTHEKIDNEQRPGVQSRTEYPLSQHEETASESVSRVERPSSTMASHRPSNSNSGNSIKRAALKNKNSPPTKISKVENVSNSTPRLVGALVQTLPQVPLTSFVEWFIETSDPNNFPPSDRPSSSSDNSPGDSTHCGFDEGTPTDDSGRSKMWQTILFNRQHEHEVFSSNNKDSRPLSTASHRQANFQDNPTDNQTEDRVPFLDGAKPKCYTEDRMPVSYRSKIPQSTSSAIPSTPSSATYGMSTLSGHTEDRLDLTRNTDAENKTHKSFLEAVKEVNILNYSRKPKEEEKLSDNIMKELCTKLASKRINENSVTISNIKATPKQTERSDTSRQMSTWSSQQHNVPSEDLTTPDSFNRNISFQRADSCTFSYPVSKTSLQYVAQTGGDASSGQIGSESTEEHDYPCKSKHDKTGRLDFGAARNWDNATDSRISRTHEEHTETHPSVGSACTSELGDVNERQTLRDKEDDNRCAPGIRHILMKLRQTTDLEEFPVPRPERTKITLRKCSDVTGIIARFQNTQP